MNDHEAAMVDTKGKVQRQLVTLMGQYLYKDAEMRLAAQHQMAAMTLSRQKMAWYIKEAEEVHRLYMDKILEFCDQFIDYCEKASLYPENLKQQATSRMEGCLYSKLMSLDAFLQSFEQTARRPLQ